MEWYTQFVETEMIHAIPGIEIGALCSVCVSEVHGSTLCAMKLMHTMSCRTFKFYRSFGVLQRFC